MSSSLAIILTVLSGYLLGSLSFAIIVTRILKNKDIRSMGSGNAGMTNALRSAGLVPGILTGIGDFAKGAAAIFLARYLFSLAGLDIQIGSYVAAVFVLVGHLFPLYFGFRGGKGIMTTAGILLVLDPALLGILLIVFLITFLISRIISLSSLVTAAFLPIVSLILNCARSTEAVFSTIFALAACAMAFLMHRANIVRLKAGTEKKFSINKQ
ncbi:MAG: glycerol-3-phosphate 1-O-acyltransferase PlsY [Oscillospiraceae bacterium]